MSKNSLVKLHVSALRRFYVETTHYENCLIGLTKSLEGFIKICLEALWGIVLSVDYPTDNIAFLFKEKLHPESLEGAG